MAELEIEFRKEFYKEEKAAARQRPKSATKKVNPPISKSSHVT
jgi:hypothetical protein